MDEQNQNWKGIAHITLVYPGILPIYLTKYDVMALWATGTVEPVLKDHMPSRQVVFGDNFIET